MSELGYNFYMTLCDGKGMSLDGASRKNLEIDFRGLRYSKADGLDSIGKAKNIYTEEYADSDRVRVHMPRVVTNSPTTVKFTFFFVGDDRREVYHEFVDYVREGYHVYYDDARRKYLYFYVSGEISPAEEMLYGSTPYLKFVFEASNLFGRTFDVPFDSAHLVE